LGAMKALSCREQLAERAAMVPVKLVNSPRRDRRLGECLYKVRVISTPALLQPCSECIAGGDELRQRELEQLIHFLVELSTILHNALVSHNEAQKARKN